MFSITEQTEEFTTLTTRIKKLAQAIVDKASDHLVEQEFEPGYRFFNNDKELGQFFFVKKGVADFEIGHNPLFFFEEGDLFSSRHTSFPDGEIVVRTQLTALVFFQTELEQAMNKDRDLRILWDEYMACEFQIQMNMMSELAKDTETPEAEQLCIAPGTIIIEEGETPDNVYMLHQGEAEVLVDGVRVGVAKSGELFGALSAVTNQYRSSTVKAVSSCFVSVVPREHFLEIAKTHPRTVFKLIEDLSAIIHAQNERIVELEKKLT